jgi:hypothetical protein
MQSRHGSRLTPLFAALALMSAGSGCYHYTFQHRPESAGFNAKNAKNAKNAENSKQEKALVTYKERRPTYLNGFVGNGEIDTTKYCAEPVRTELRVTAVDVILSFGTLLIYTPHTLYVTCEASSRPDVASASR